MTEEQPQLGKTELLLKNVRKMPIFRQLIPQEASLKLPEENILINGVNF